MAQVGAHSIWLHTQVTCDLCGAEAVHVPGHDCPLNIGEFAEQREDSFVFLFENERLSVGTTVDEPTPDHSSTDPPPGVVQDR